MKGEGQDWQKGQSKAGSGEEADASRESNEVKE